jgi:DNA-binding XRE family transcriptional regulator
MKPNDSKAHSNDGERLKIIRRSHKKSQREIADEFDVSVGTVANYEKAKTEMPPSFSRAVLKRYGKNPIPPDPEEDPRRLLSESTSSTMSDESKQPCTIAVRLMRQRKRYSAIREKVYLPSRLIFDDVMHALFTTASLVFAIEQLRRILPLEVQDHILIASAVTTSFLFIPVLKSIPWGMTPLNNGEA